MSSNTNVTSYTYGAGPSGTTPGGTSFGVNLSISAQAGSDFTDATAWTLYDALLTALTSVGWSIGSGDLSLTKQQFDDTQFVTNVAAKTFS